MEITLEELFRLPFIKDFNELTNEITINVTVGDEIYDYTINENPVFISFTTRNKTIYYINPQVYKTTKLDVNKERWLCRIFTAKGGLE